MSNLLRTDDKAIQSVLLYQFLQGKSSYFSFEEFNNIVRDNFLRLDVFKFWFKRFENGKFDEKDDNFSISDFKIMLSDDKHCLRACIFFEYLKEILMKSGFHHGDVFAAYKRMSKVIDIDYPEFDFCFYRFINGVFNLDFEYNPAQIFSFSDLSLKTIKRIVKKLDFLDRCRIRKLSHDLRNAVDGMKIGISNFDIIFSVSNVLVTVTKMPHFLKFGYWKIEDTFPVENNMERFRGEDYLVSASNDLSILLNMSEIDRLCICILGIKQFATFENILNSLNAKLHVKSLSMFAYNADHFAKTLSFVETGTLETITVTYDPHCDDIVKRKAKDGWEREETVRLHSAIYPVPVEYLINFPNIEDVSFQYKDALQLIQIKEALLKLHHVQSWHFLSTPAYPIDDNEMDNLFGPIEARGVRRLEIPNTNAYYEVEVFGIGMLIYKANH
ncbi:unnamed protein product [Caenorhabditis nigoni]